jgi:beta-lactam-binding protein with PASTA domain
VLKAHGFNIAMQGSGELVAEQHPAQDELAPRRSEVMVSLVRITQDTTRNMMRVPDVLGMSLRQAMTLVKGMNLDPSPAGSGVVVRQYPEAGTLVEPGTRCTLVGEAKRIYTANLY